MTSELRKKMKQEEIQEEIQEEMWEKAGALCNKHEIPFRISSGTP